MALRKHVPPHLRTPIAKRAAAMAAVLACEGILALIALSAVTGGAASERATHSERSDPKELLARPERQKPAASSVALHATGNPAARNRAIAALAHCVTDSGCAAAEQALRASGCSLQESGVILCPLREPQIAVANLPPL